MTHSELRVEELNAGFYYGQKMAGISAEDLLPSDEHTLELTVLLGGRRDFVEDFLRGDPASRNAVVAIDLDSMNVPRNSGRFVALNAEGALPRVNRHKDQFRSLRGDQVPDNLRLPKGCRGAGLRRIVALVALFYEWQKVVTKINEAVQEKLAEFENRRPKRLVFRIVSSLGGGTGSALIIPVAMLLRDSTSMKATNLDVRVELHAVSGMVFLSKLKTDLERRRCLANSARTLREIMFAQVPGNRRPLALALGMNPRDEQDELFDDIVFYGEVNSGSKYQSEERLHAIIAANFLAGANEDLEELASHAENTRTSQQDRDHDVFATLVSMVARVPVSRIATTQAWKTQELELRSLLETGAEPREISRASRNRVLNDLGFSKTIQQTTQTLRRRFNEGTDREEFRNASDRDDQSLQRDLDRRMHFYRDAGQGALEQEVERLRGTFIEQTEQHAAHLIELARSLAVGLPSCRSLLAVLTAAIEEEFARVSERLEELRKQDMEKVLNHHWDVWRRESSTPRWRRRSSSRDVCLETWKRLVESTLELQALELFRDCWLAPIGRMLIDQQERIAEREIDLEVRRLAMQREASHAAREIPFDNGFFTTILSTRDIEPVLQKLASAVSLKYAGQPAVLSLDDVLDTPREELQSVMQAGWEKHLQRVEKFFADDLKDLRGFLEFYPETEFNAARWMAAASQQPLPACLSIYHREPGNSPVFGIIVGPGSFKETWQQVEYAIRPEIQMEWQDSRQPFELIVQLSRTAVPVAALPGLDDMIQAEHFIEQLPPRENDPAMSILWSHGLLRAARQFPLTPEEEAGLDAISDTDSSAERDDVPQA